MDACVCETNESCLLLYRSIEYGTLDREPLSPAVMAWLPQYVADVEAECPAPLHYQSLMLDELLSRDVTTQHEDESDIATYWDAADEYLAAYGKRTEEGGRFIETHDGSDLAVDRDSEDWTTKIRCHEMAKKRELRDWMLSLGLSPAAQAPWVAERIALKRQDAIREKQLAEKRSFWTEGFPLPPESQIRLRAYASCLASLQKPSGFASAKAREPKRLVA